MNKRIIIRCRGVIINNEKLLVVQGHGKGHDYFALPGGKLDFGETPQECMIREIYEELGVKAEIERLLYINTFSYGGSKKDKHSVEFIFLIKNSENFIKCENIKASHSHELAKIKWLEKNDQTVFRPIQIQEDFNAGTLPEIKAKFLD